jgi:anti-sigma factor RsiW
MTCRDQERLLSLYVEGDLPAHDVAVVEEHLEACEPCRRFLRELRSSQSSLKELAAEPLNRDALASVRVRVRSASRERPGRAPGALYGAMAASLIAAVGGLVWLLGREARPPGPPLVAAAPSPAPPSARPPAEHVPRGVSRLRPAREEQVSTVRGPRRVALVVGVPKPVATLSPEDADQLARAVLAVSRIESLADATVRPAAPPARPPLVRLATSDPDIVIYWQLESDGGK